MSLTRRQGKLFLDMDTCSGTPCHKPPPVSELKATFIRLRGIFPDPLMDCCFADCPSAMDFNGSNANVFLFFRFIIIISFAFTIC